jgi:hypothetical protein
MVAADAFRACLMAPGGTIETCAAAALETMNTCLANCGNPPTCEQVCNARAADVFGHCVLSGGNPLHCGELALAAFNECMVNCTPP